MLLDEVRLLEKAAVIVVRHEADFHALLLVGGLEVAMPRHFARVALGLFAERKHRARQLVLPQRKKEIALVLLQIPPALEEITALVGTPSYAGSRRVQLRNGFARLLRGRGHRSAMSLPWDSGALNPRKMARGDVTPRRAGSRGQSAGQTSGSDCTSRTDSACGRPCIRRRNIG